MCGHGTRRSRAQLGFPCATRVILGENACMATVLGIDIGGTGIKGAPVDTTTGKLLADRHRILTPRPATPKAVAEVVGELAAFFDWKGPTGATFPAVVKRGVTMTAANVDKTWIGTDAVRDLRRRDRRDRSPW